MFKSIKDKKVQCVVILSRAKNLAWFETTAGPFAVLRVTKPVSMSYAYFDLKKNPRFYSGAKR
jgi:hypothetical protein